MGALLALVLLVALAPACSTGSDPQLPGAGKADILWDEWGVPHIYAGDEASLFRAFGSAQMQSHANLLLELMVRARGEAAAYGGAEFVASDRTVHVMGLRERGQQWYDAQTPQFRADVDAFAAGMTEWADGHRDQLDGRLAPALPIRGPDVFAHVARTTFEFVAETSGCAAVFDGADRPAGRQPGSNGWALGPSRTADGAPLLLANPHLGWSGDQLLYEAQLVSGEVSVYGAALVGFPTISIGFTDKIGWTHTVNPIDACDLYQLTPAGRGGYRYDGAVRPFDTRTDTLRVRRPDGRVVEQPLPLRWAVQGPVVTTDDGRTAAVRITSVGATSTPGLLQQWWDMARAEDLAGFRAVLDRNQLPMFNVLYTGRDEHVFAAFAGQVPRRPADYGGRWDGPVPGDTAATLWTDVLPFAALPQVVDPPGGFVQNSNSAPWTYTLPRVPELDPARYPRDLPGEGLSWRERRGLQLIADHPRMSLDDVVRLKYDTRMGLADRVLPELIAAARTSRDGDAVRAAEVLDAWDRQALPTSRGALLFLAWTLTALPDGAPADGLFATPYDPGDPLATPRGLADPDGAATALGKAARTLVGLTGRLDVPWGEAMRLQRGTVDLPANGFPGDPYGVFRVLTPDLSRIEGGKPSPVVFGDSFVAAVRFSDPVAARVLTTYGNATQPGSPHAGDQLRISADGQLRTAWLTRAEVEQHVSDRRSLG